MNLKHKVCVSVGCPTGGTSEVLKGGSRTVRSRLLNFLFGEEINILVLTPGKTVETVEIRELPAGGDAVV